MNRPTYVFENGRAYAFVGGQVVASADSLEELQRLAWNDGGGEDPAYQVPQEQYPTIDEQVDHSPFAGEHAHGGSPCPACGEPNGIDQSGECGACGYFDDPTNSAAGDRFQEDGGEPYGDPGDDFPDPAGHSPWDHNASYSHVETPNGLKGKILGRVSNVWGDQIRVRFENGHIAQFDVSDGLKFSTEEPGDEVGPVPALRERLDEQVIDDRETLAKRAQTLKEIKAEATDLIREGSLSEADVAALDGIIVQATHESVEVADALEYLASAESFIPEAPFQTTVVEQEAVGRTASANWLDAVTADVIAEAEGTDFQKLIDEGPEAFVAELDDAPLADQGVTHQMASSYIRTKTAGVQDEGLRDKYEKMWVERVEGARRNELASRKQDVRKQAAVEQDEHESAPDETLFL